MKAPPVNVTNPTAGDAPSVAAVGMTPNIFVAVLIVLAVLLLWALRKGFVGALGD